MKYDRTITLLSIQDERKRRIRQWTICGVIACLTVMLVGAMFLSGCYADDVTVIAQIEKLNLPRNTIVHFLFRQLGWSIIKGMCFIVNGLSSAVFSVNSATGGILTDKNVESLMEKVRYIGFALLGLVLVYIGIQFVIKPQKAGTITTNFIVGILVFISLPTLVMGSYKIVESGIAYLGNGQISSMGTQVLTQNITDVYEYDQNGLSPNLATKSSFAASSDPNGILNIDPVEMIDSGSMQNKDFWGNTVTTDASGNQKLKGLGDGKILGFSFPIFSQQYYRWNFDWLNIFISLGVTAFALVMTGIKIARIIIELVIKQTLGQVLGLLDIHTGQKMKQCLQSILSSLVALFGCSLMLQFYIIATAAVVKNTGNIFVKLLVELALAWVVIDGPDIFERMFGMDVGIKHPMATMYGLQSLGHAITGTGRAITGTRMADGSRYGGLFGKKGVVDNATNAASYAAGGIGGLAGFAKGKHDANRQMNSSRNRNTNSAGSPEQNQSADLHEQALQMQAKTGMSPRDAFLHANAHSHGNDASVKQGSGGTSSSANAGNNTNSSMYGASQNYSASPSGNPAYSSRSTNGQKSSSYTVPESMKQGNASIGSSIPVSGGGSVQRPTGKLAAAMAKERENSYANNSPSSAFGARQAGAELNGDGPAGGMTTGEYISSHLKDGFEKSRFARPKRAYHLAYDLSKNSLIRKQQRKGAQQ